MTCFSITITAEETFCQQITWKILISMHTVFTAGIQSTCLGVAQDLGNAQKLVWFIFSVEMADHPAISQTPLTFKGGLPCDTRSWCLKNTWARGTSCWKLLEPGQSVGYYISVPCLLLSFQSYTFHIVKQNCNSDFKRRKHTGYILFPIYLSFPWF